MRNSCRSLAAENNAPYILGGTGRQSRHTATLSALLSAFEKSRLMRSRRTRPEFTSSILATGWRTGSQIPARVLVEFHTLLISVRLVLHHVVEPIQSPFLEIEGGPRSESHTTSRSGKQSRLTNPSRFLAVAETMESLHAEGTCESRADANVRRVRSFRKVS